MSALKPWEAIRQLEANNSKLFKESYIGTIAASGHDDFFKGLRYALDGFDTFGVKKVPERSGPDGPGLTMEIFSGWADMLISRELTGDDARNMIDAMMKLATNDQWNNWYRRILMKDLKAGFSETTVNKAVKGYPKYNIPIFSCQLAHDMKDRPEKLAGRKMIDVKLDGARVLTIVHPDGRAYQVSRNGKEITNFPKIVAQWASIASGFSDAVVIDGEMMSDNFQALMKQFRRKTNVQTDDAVYFVFDIVPLKEFQQGESVAVQQIRRDALILLVDMNQASLPNVVAVEYDILDLDTPAGKTKFNDLNRTAIENKYEGMMIKDLDAKYETKRTWAWMKLKPRISVTLPIVRVDAGDPDSKYADVMGALWCEGQDGDEYIEVSCGGGFSDELRKQLWEERANLPGVLVEIEADAITKNQDGRYSLRFPRFKSFRGYVPGEKI